MSHTASCHTCVDDDDYLLRSEIAALETPNKPNSFAALSTAGLLKINDNDAEKDWCYLLLA